MFVFCFFVFFFFSSLCILLPFFSLLLFFTLRSLSSHHHQWLIAYCLSCLSYHLLYVILHSVSLSFSLWKSPLCQSVLLSLSVYPSFSVRLSFFRLSYVSCLSSLLCQYILVSDSPSALLVYLAQHIFGFAVFHSFDTYSNWLSPYSH